MNILIIDDEPDLVDHLRRALEKRNYRVEAAMDGDLGLDAVLEDRHDLVLLDIMLPGIDGFTILERMRRAAINTPVIMLTARDDVSDRVRGLDNGADDYLAKPFSLAELLARIRAILRRGSQRSSVLEAGSLTLDPAGRRAHLGGRALNLTSKEFSILEFLLYNKGSAVSRFNLAEHVWGDDYDPFSMSNFIDVHIKNIRKKIQAQGGGNPIKTIRGVGFIIE